MGEAGNPGFDAKEIGAVLLKAKTGGNEISFAFGLAGKPEDSGLVTDLRRGPKALKGDLKALPTRFAKTCFGTFTVVENDVRFQSARPAKGMIKALRKLFRDAGMGKYKPMLVGPDGQEIDEDTLPDLPEGEDEDGAPAAPEPGPGAPPAEFEALKRRVAEIVRQLSNLPEDLAGRLRQACQIAAQQIGAQDQPAATRTVEQLEAVLARQSGALASPQPASPPPPSSPPPPAPSAAPLARLQEALVLVIGRIKALPEGGVRAELVERARAIAGLIRDGAAEQALAGLRSLGQALAGSEAAGSAAPAPAPGAEATAIWRDAKAASDKSVAALCAALRGFGDAELTRIADTGLTGVAETAQAGLTAALEAFRQAGSSAAAQTVAQRVAECRTMLDTDPLVALCEDNPFGVAVAIRATLGRALNRIETLARAA